MCSAKWITSWTPSNYQVETKTKASTKFRRECHACICRKGGIVVFSRWWTQWQRAHLDDRGIDDRVCRQRASRQAGSHRACGGDALRDERHSTPAYRTAVHTVLWCCCCHSRGLLQTHSSLCWQTQIYWKPLSGASSLLRLLKGNYLDFTNLLIPKNYLLSVHVYAHILIFPLFLKKSSSSNSELKAFRKELMKRGRDLRLRFLSWEENQYLIKNLKKFMLSLANFIEILDLIPYIRKLINKKNL